MNSIQNRIQSQVQNSQLKEAENKKKTIIELLEKHKEQIKKALPNPENVDRIIRIIQTALSKNESLTKCNPVTILACAIESAQLGLTVDNILGECFFVPFWNNKKKQYEAQLIVGYKGYMKLAYRSGEINKIFAEIVREGDEFSYQYGTDEYLKHIPKKNLKSNMLYVYAYATTNTGATFFVVLSKEEVEYYRSKSKSGDSELSAWSTDYEAMAKKTAIRRLSKFLPLSPELKRVSQIENLYEEGISPELEKEYHLVEETEAEVIETKTSGDKKQEEQSEKRDGEKNLFES